MIRILLADDHDVVRRGLKALLQDTGWQICGEARSGREAVELAGELKPDIAIVDLMVSEPNGLDTTRQIRKASPRTQVLIFTMHHNEATVTCSKPGRAATSSTPTPSGRS